VQIRVIEYIRIISVSLNKQSDSILWNEHVNVWVWNVRGMCVSNANQFHNMILSVS